MKNIIRFISVFVITLTIFCSVSFSQNKQNKNEIILNVVQKLQQKVLLSNDQTNQVKSILSDYSKELSEEDKKSADSRIENLLDSKQKAKYSIIKNDWWNEVKRDLSEAEKGK